MKTKLFLFLIIVALSLYGCVGTAYKENLTKGYSMSAMDVMTDMSLVFENEEGYSFDVVTSTVFAVGYNDEFIIIMQHPREFPNPPDKSVINHFIIPLEDRVSGSPESNVVGPFSKGEFEIKRRELGIPDDLIFSKVIKELQ